MAHHLHYVKHVQPLQEKKALANEDSEIPEFKDAMEAAAFYKEFIKSYG